MSFSQNRCTLLRDMLFRLRAMQGRHAETVVATIAAMTTLALS